LVGLVLHLESGGCASRPAPALITHQIKRPLPGILDKDINLKLLTYNIWGLPSWMTGAPTGRYPRIARELQKLDPDIILLQEAWTENARKSAPTNGNWSIARAAGQHAFFQQCGLLTLSKFPILGGEFHPFSRASFPDRFVTKGVLKITLALRPGFVIDVWNVHLQDGGPPQIEQSQVSELVSWVRGTDDHQIADIVGGDFNCTPKSGLYKELENALGPSVLRLGNNQPFVTWDGLSSKPGAGETFDHIFIHRRASIQSVEAQQHVAFTSADKKQRLSDHFAVESAVKLTLTENLASVIGAPSQRRALPSFGTLAQFRHEN
jgi:endonuclease/exonuclease/phosphatase family metal-dependent hydrolase